MIAIKHSQSLCEPFVDYLNISSPKDNLQALRNALRPIIDALGMSEVTEGLFSLPERLGTLKFATRGKVCIVSASGGFLSLLRSRSIYNHYLAEFANFEHRISMMHVTCDYSADSPKVLAKLYQKASTGGIYLTRKAVNPDHVSKLLGRNREGADTGTVYLGSRANSDVWAKVYDKRQERLAKGEPDIQPMLRVEIAVQSDVNATLRDASLPSDIFYHHASRSLVEAPASFTVWQPHAQGFEIPPNQFEPTPHERLTLITENSFDITRIFELAHDSYGDDALAEIQKVIRNRFIKFKNGQVSQK